MNAATPRQKDQFGEPYTKRRFKSAATELREHLRALDVALNEGDTEGIDEWGAEIIPLAHNAISAARGAGGLPADEY